MGGTNCLRLLPLLKSRRALHPCLDLAMPFVGRRGRHLRSLHDGMILFSIHPSTDSAFRVPSSESGCAPQPILPPAGTLGNDRQ